VAVRRPRGAGATRERLLSLDVFRGLTMAAMVLVNNPGTWAAVYRPLTHAEWHGWTPTDLVFPFFLFIVGVSIPLALGARRAGGAAASGLVLRVGWRSVVIFGLGLTLNVVAALRFVGDLDTVRVMGVLQRIALCYLGAALLFLGTSARVQAAVAALLLVGYWALLTFVPVPGVGAGDLGREGNLAAWLDRLVLGRHIYRAGKVYDPEGILGTLPAIATTLSGVLAGQWVASAGSPSRRLAGLVGAGTLALTAGLAWGAWFPINKALWTSSYALFSAGAAALGLATCMLVVDAWGFRRWAMPFVVFGTNALALFFLSTLVALLLITTPVTEGGGVTTTLHAWLYRRLFAPWATPVNASLAWAIAYLLFWLGAMWLLYRRRIFIRV
jgi:predicted acyltransferase